MCHGINRKHARRIPQRVWKPAQRTLSVLNTARDTRDLGLPGLHFEPLQHDRPGYNSVRINDQYRIVFRFERGDAYEILIEDFHGGK